MDAEKVMQIIGSQGKYHVILGTLLSMTLMNLAINNLTMVIYGYAPPHRCSSNEGIQPKNISSNLTWTHFGSCIETSHNNKTVTKIPCQNGWTFDLEEKQSTIVNEFSLVCDKKYLGMMSVSVYFFGLTIGVTVFGILADKIGRRQVMLATMFGQIIVGAALSFSPNYICYVILRFLLGFFVEGLPATAFVMLTEMMPFKSRAFYAGLYEIFWPVGSVWMACISWAVKDWRTIQLIFSLMNLYAIIYIWLIPESVRWSIAKGRIDEAMKYVTKITRFNKIVLPEDFSIKAPEKIEEPEGKQIGFFRSIVAVITTTKIIRKRALCMFHIWMTSSFLYYGISLNLSTLSGNVYKNLFILSILEVPAVILAIILFWRVGRRSPLIVYYFIAGAACITAGCLPDTAGDGTNLRPYVAALAFIGKFFVTAAFTNLAIFTSELFPTTVRYPIRPFGGPLLLCPIKEEGVCPRQIEEVRRSRLLTVTLTILSRNTLYGGCQFWSRIGAIIAPQIIVIGIFTFKELPFIFFGILSAIASFAAWLLPETKGARLHDTVEEVEGEKIVKEIKLIDDNALETEKLTA